MSDSMEPFDFTPIGQAIKKAREEQKTTREQAVEPLGIAPRHLQAIENEGQYPSFPLFVQLVRMFNVSVDQYIFPERGAVNSTRRRQLDALLDGLNEQDLTVVESTVRGLLKAKE